MELEQPDPVRAGRRRRVLITGAGGQLGHALRQAFADDDVLALSRAEWDVTQPLGDTVSRDDLDLVLHTACVDGRRRCGVRPAGGGGGQRSRAPRTAAALKAPLVTFSTDYVFDGRKHLPYVESDGPNPASAYGRTKLHGEAAAGTNAWVVRTSWLFGPTGHNFLRTMLRLAAERGEVSVVDDQRGCPTFVGHLAEAVHLLVDDDRPKGVWHVAAAGDCTWAEFAEAIFEETGAECRVRRITTAEFARPAPRPMYSVLRSERQDAPLLPHWRDGLRACLAEMDR
jgi:dTDP-4-dehydrorhamnose reductase